MIKVAILARKEMAAGREPFQWRYQISKHFVDVFNALNALLIPIVSEHGITDVLAACDALIIPGSPNCIPPKYYGGAPIEACRMTLMSFNLIKRLSSSLRIKESQFLVFAAVCRQLMLRLAVRFARSLMAIIRQTCIIALRSQKAAFCIRLSAHKISW